MFKEITFLNLNVPSSVGLSYYQNRSTIIRSLIQANVRKKGNKSK